jgi:hypothetical protein
VGSEETADGKAEVRECGVPVSEFVGDEVVDITLLLLSRLLGALLRQSLPAGPVGEARLLT